MKIVSAEEAVKFIKSGDHIFVQSVAAAPQTLIKAMTARSDELRNVEIYHLHTEGVAPYSEPQYSESFHTNSFFIGSNVRKAVALGEADFIPCFLSEVPLLMRRGIIPIDVALIHVSPPDRHGYCSLGTSIDVTLAGVQTAKTVIAQVNPKMPRTHGDGLLHVSEIDHAVMVNDEIHELPLAKPTPEEIAIGKYCAELVADGATIQMGIGAIPNAVLLALTDHKDLGVHTEMFSDGLIPLLESGVVNGKKKKVHPKKVVASFVMGTRKLYDFIDDNPEIAMLDVAYVNDPAVIRRNPKVTAINSAIEVDLTGQVCADSIGSRMYSGVGGQIDFIRGASLSEGGKPIIALPSTTNKGESKITPFLKEGAGVVTTRANVHWVVTEYGAVNLYGKTLRQRAIEMISIAHPDHREELSRQAYERFKILLKMPSFD
ncbi:MAG TPA: acetyl-CoA hydrolase/transferase C-terminal domain-containing protein [Pyrinomonadaceae bacterium]|nr:acetyl-CoA hydrolase/transferase C-terminal domain-containing protein [Pyrinomonadaceae bacterium]